MRKLSVVVMAIASVAVGFFASASDYVPTVREDRVWQYHYVSGDPMTEEYTSLVLESRFDGEAEFNGVTYHCFKTEVKHVLYGESRLFPVYYMRESDGKVYLYTPDSRIDKESAVIGSTYLPAEMKESGEVVVYDFTCSKGSVISGVNAGVCSYTVVSAPDRDNIWLSSVKYMVEDVSVERIGDTDCRKIRMDYATYAENGNETPESGLDTKRAAEDLEYGYVCIEGLGLVSNNGSGELAYLPFFDSNIYPTGFTFRDTMNLVGVFDAEGNLLYGENKDWSGIETISTQSTVMPVYYNLHGQPVANPVHGEIYILRDSSGSRKVVY